MATELSKILITVVVVIIALTSFSLILGDMVNQYSISGYRNIETNYNSSYIVDVTELADDVSNKTLESPSPQTLGDLLIGIPVGAFNSITLLFSSGNLLSSLISDTASLIGVPPIIISYFGLIVSLIVIAAILSIYFRRDV